MILIVSKKRAKQVFRMKHISRSNLLIFDDY